MNAPRLTYADGQHVLEDDYVFDGEMPLIVGDIDVEQAEVCCLTPYGGREVYRSPHQLELVERG